MSVARYLAALGERVRVIDSRAAPPGLAALDSACPAAEVELATLDARWLDGVSRVLLSPGLSVDIPLVAEARRRGLEVIGDVELFARAANAPVIAVTGSNGKSTVATLAAEMLTSQGLVAPAGGNLGPPALDILRDDADAYVLEISSFQMETTDSLRPLSAALLNVSSDHLDRHGTFERYAALKAKLLEAADNAVYNADDSVVAAIGARHPHATPVSVERSLSRGYSIVERGGERWLARDGEPLMKRAALVLRGTHNESNALAALALTEKLNVDRAAARRRAAQVRGLAAPLSARRRAARRRVHRRLEGHERRRDARGSQWFRGAARADRGRLGQGPGHGAARVRRARQVARRGADRRGGRRDCRGPRAALFSRSRGEHG